MPVTVQLDLDAGAEATLGALAEVLSGIPGLTTVRQLGDVHHISMAIYDDPPLERFMPALADLAETLSPIEVQLAHIGLFVGTTSVGSSGVKSVGVDGSGVEGLGAYSLGKQPQGVVFLGVVVTETLLALHRRVHVALGAFRESCWAHYLPGAWVPHVSLALDATNGAAQAATAALLARWSPMTVKTGGARLVRFRPVSTLYKHMLA